MPIYEYTCSRCRHEFETLVRSGAVPDCPQCGATELVKKLSVFATADAGADAGPSPGACAACPHGGGGPCGLD